MHKEQFSIETTLFQISCLLFLTSYNPHHTYASEIIGNNLNQNFTVCIKESLHIGTKILSVIYKNTSSNLVLILVVALFIVFTGLSFYFKRKSVKQKNNKTKMEEELSKPTWI